MYSVFLLPYPSTPVVAGHPGEAEHAPHHLPLLPHQLGVLLSQHHAGLGATGEAGVGTNLQLGVRIR